MCVKNNSMRTTNVNPSDLNYDKYTTDKYDRDIVNSIPFHREVHDLIAGFASSFKKGEKYEVLDLGVGTAITSRMLKDILPNSHFDLVDFSQRMLNGAKKKMGKENARYIFGDYSKIKFDQKYNIVISVIGVHHQNIQGKKKLFKKIFCLLNNGGYFIFGDLVTYLDKRKAALNNAKHFKYLAEKATDEKTLSDWAYHHMFLNDLAPVEEQVKWLKEIGFKVSIKFLKFNTALIICKK